MICCCTEKQSMFSISLKTKKEIPHRSKFAVSAQHIITKLQTKQNMLKTLKKQQEFSKLAMVFVPNAAGIKDGEIGNKKSQGKQTHRDPAKVLCVGQLIELEDPMDT